MLITAFIVNFAFEIVAFSFPVFYNNSYEYRASLLRYLFTIALGLWIMDKMGNMDLIKILFEYKFILIGLITSSIYLIMISVFDWKFPYFLPDWRHQSLFSAFYPLIFCILGIRYFPSQTSNKLMNFIGIIGKASYHIFLVQIIYFASGLSMILFILNSGLYANYGLYALLFVIMGDLVACLILGLSFFYLESKLNKIINYQLNKIIDIIYQKIKNIIIIKPSK